MQADKRGAAVAPVGAMDESTDTIYRARDMAMVKLASRGMTQRAIGVFFGVDQRTVGRRIQKVPPHVREKIARRPLGWLE